MGDPRTLDFVGGDEEKPVNIPVYLRIKPLGASEESSLRVIDDTTVETNHDGRANKKATFTRVFQGQVSQQQVFDNTTASLLQRFLDGANVMTFAYGVTSSGKTFTIMGSHSNPGLVPRVLERIFGHYQLKISTSMLTYKPVLFEGSQHLKVHEISELRRLKTSLLAKVKSSKPGFAHYAFKSRTEDQGSGNDLHATIVSPANFCTVWISVYEIYNEIITDLLVSDCNKLKRKPLTIGQDTKGRTFVKDLTQLPVSSAAEAYSLLQVAKQNLAKASTRLNDNSSRSHMVFNIKMVHWGGSCPEPLVNHFVISDLAGSERQAKTGTSGMTLKQASAINNSLLVLGRCLEALRKKDRGISAPFRDSKLTRILNPFFTLGGYVSLIICINPHMSLKDETLDTIRFSAIASEIVQDTTRPLERLRKLRRLTQTCAADPDAAQYESQEVDTDLVESWRDAVGSSALHNGIRYLEIKASYFKDMARDILYAEKQLIANEEEIESLKARLKAAELSKENIHLMYEDRMKEQRDKFLALKAELKEFYENERAMMLSSLNEEIETYEQKYIKYRNGYAKVSAYLEEKVWPEIRLFRERFGYLPEFPPTGSGDDQITNPENTIRFWREKLERIESENRRLRQEVTEKTDQLNEMSRSCEQLKRLIEEPESETTVTNERSDLTVTMIEEFENTLLSMQERCNEVEVLSHQVSALREELRISEETKKSLAGEHEVIVNTLNESLAEITLQFQETQRSKGAGDGVDNRTDGDTRQQEEVMPISFVMTDVQGFLADVSDLVQKLISTLVSCCDVAGVAGNLQETILIFEKFKELGLEFDTQPCTAPFSDAFGAKFRKLSKELASKLSSVDFGLGTRSKISEDLQFSERERNQVAEENDHLREANIQLRQRLQEIQDSLIEKELKITAQASELEELRQKTIDNEVLKTKTEVLETENQELRKRLRNLRMVETFNLNYGKQTQQAQVENRMFSQLENSLEASSRCADGASLDDSSERGSKNSKQRRRLRIENDENCFLDRTLQESIQDTSPIRSFKGIQRKR